MTPPTLENRLPPEDLLERDDHPLRELAWLVAASLAVLAVLVLVTGLSARWLAPKLPFEYEVALAERVFDAEPKAAASADAAAERERRVALQSLADRVAAVMALPPGMKVVVSDDASELVNAYATVGGRIRVFHGLLRKLDSEQALAALLAHEIAHVKHRHVAANMGHGLAVSLLLSVVMPEGAAQAAQGLLGGAAQLALLGYSRDAERQADAEALAASLALYGHAGGLAALFTVLPQADHAPSGTAWLRSHPDTVERLAVLKAAAGARGAAMVGAVTPLPGALRALPPAAAHKS
ncbi:MULTISPECIES: M48 family metallopeptidase [unclassified Roseateles]|uniref:M48 family metallopeptidase n=1 Tax=unclassified Roseateles TaxID=2626991 RepID=UPI000A80F18E|nr:MULTISPECIES: M48 family metallopeptidase [unclassified Roseateles]